MRHCLVLLTYALYSESDVDVLQACMSQPLSTLQERTIRREHSVRTSECDVSTAFDHSSRNASERTDRNVDVFEGDHRCPAGPLTRLSDRREASISSSPFAPFSSSSSFAPFSSSSPSSSLVVYFFLLILLPLVVTCYDARLIYLSES